jgi:hypothetical protein
MSQFVESRITKLSENGLDFYHKQVKTAHRRLTDFQREFLCRWFIKVKETFGLCPKITRISAAPDERAQGSEDSDAL